MNATSSDTPNHPVPQQSTLIGHRLIYTYDNGWVYEMYVKNADTIDYRIHSGIVGGRWVRDQRVDLVQLADDVHKVSWHEPTGTSVVVNVMPSQNCLHGTIFFPRWVADDPAKTVLFQNDHVDLMRAYRDEGPTYPVYVVPEFATITHFEYVGPDDESVISSAPPGDNGN
jgi:phenolic acid decarboxylase